MQLHFGLLLAVVGLVSPEQSPICRRRIAPVQAWVVSRSPRLPGLTLRLPIQFIRDSAEDSYDASHPGAANGSRWAHANGSQLSIMRVNAGEPEFLLPTPSDTLPEYKRCVERVDRWGMVLVSYNRLTEVGDLAFIGPFLIFANLGTANGSRLQVTGSATSRESYEQLQVAVRTLRRDDP
jgi:hypothetical protein